MSGSGKKPLSRSLGQFVGHIARAFRTDPSRADRSVTLKKTVEEKKQGKVVLRRTTIEEMELPQDDDAETDTHTK
ncbi:MAG: hypothetical protein ACYTGC_01845 [Planctomycetota bacterium]|jgi:hypothetical protein